MLKRQIDRVWLKITSQARIIFLKPYRGGSKRQFLDQFADKIESVIPDPVCTCGRVLDSCSDKALKRESIMINSTGLLAELRLIKDNQKVSMIITEGGHDEE